MPLDKKSTFYDSLVSGVEKRGILGLDSRFNVDKIYSKRSTERYFINLLSTYLSKETRVLDYGCGPGTFLVVMSSLCKEVVGVDTSLAFVELCKKNIDKYKITNATVEHIDALAVDIPKEYFDAVVMVDVIHHVENPSVVLANIASVLRPGGKLLVFEPNKLNPLIYFLHLKDKNEHGLLRLGSPKAYKTLFTSHYKIETWSYNGLVVGPNSKVFDYLTSLLNINAFRKYVSWLNPKLFFVITPLSSKK